MDDSDQAAGHGPRPPARDGDVFTADHEVGPDLLEVDWAATPLGPPRDWPQSLQTAVSILLSSRFPMWMAWGEQLTFFCNAAYRRDTLGRKYPWALGRPANEVWAEIWDDIGPRIEAVLTTGEATWDEGLLLFLERSGYSEETYHTFSYSPLRDDAGAVVGMLCVVSEDTDRVIGERRMATLRDLGSDPSVIRTEEEVLAFADRQLDRNRKDLPFTLTYLFDGSTARLAGSTGIPVAHPAAPAVLRIEDPDSAWPVAAPAAGETALVPLASDALADLPAGDWPEPPVEALVVPLLQQGSVPYGFLVAALNRYRVLDEGYRGFVELTAGHIASGIGSARSYEAQQRRAEELAELDRAKTVFFSNISHEFRTPLTLIMGPIEELRTRLAGAEEHVRRELDLVHRNGLRLGKLVNTLLDFSRIEAGRMQARYEPVDLAVVTAELASVFRSAMERAGLAFDVDCPPLAEPVYVDRGMWEKVVLNLLSNALKFTFTGSVRVGVHRDGTDAVVTVTDTGIGVPEPETPRLFERFHRIENARSRSNEGSGIGLALVRELVGLHGGTITAASREGEGTTFTVRLPFGNAHLPPEAVVSEAAGSSAPVTADPYVQEALRWLPENGTGTADGSSGVRSEADAVATGSGPAAGARVLVADDNADMREYLARVLGQAGYEVTTVTDGVEALRAVRRDLHDLVVSDVMMPRLDGLELVARLRGDTRTASVPVLLLSARAGQEASIEGLRAGADDYLVKPFAVAELLARVRAIIELARLRGHHVRWRTALVDSLQEAFFVCDESGAVVEINTAFTDILGYGPEELPYTSPQPWWPDAATGPEAHRQVGDAFAGLLRRDQGSHTVPVTHRDGHRLWVAVTFNKAQDPDTGRRVTVGTFRDVTAEHYAVRRETALAALGTTLSQAASLPEALSGALVELRTLWRARSVVAALFERGDVPAVTAAEEDLRWADLPAERRDALVALRRQTPLTPVAGDSGAGILLEHPDGPLALWIDLGEHRPFTPEDRFLLSLLAGHLTQGLVRAHQIDQQRRTAIALQRAILGPARLPAGFAVRYEPATRPLEVGGDWYDTVALADGRIGIVVGDCVGRGLEAASVMGQLRSACRALMLQDPSPSRTLMALDQFAASVPGALCTTVFCGVLDPGTGELTYSSAGHPPGILAHPDGATRLLDEGRSLPLAVRPGRRRPEAACTLPARATLLLYTDGLVERRGRPLSAGIDQAGEAVQNGRAMPVDDLATEVMSRLAPAGGYDDDVALLLYRHPTPLEMSFPAESAQLAPVRKALRNWLARCDLPANTVQNVLVAAGEACANAVEHGHRHNPGEAVRLRAEARADDLWLTVADSGLWKVPEPEENTHRGRGVALMRAMMQHVTITPGPSGTTVDMQLRIDR
ncbi:SpoIIE family protein phosphatase [Streptomyces sp. Ag109_O5-10]|uniref:SpoIIE family protein phosphatase n=1 Tax=Streptomyces sp. Ag109_O5-10 TaxID=1855349 RepID=UPI00089BC0F6|nr:SpoIIE family protein phosphatase [Streptomyces sp. Ag109_O5-10]SEE39979.1 PAS domain S-box-containing protein [Streptomyces sp. Ag109_O5-10]